MAELHDLTVLQQAAAIRRRDISPVELVDHYLARITELADRVGAFITVTADSARAQAKDAERAVLDNLDLPPLHGVPIAVKDLSRTKGVRTTFGSRVFADFVPDEDDYVVQQLQRAGTISLGKTNTPEFGLPCYTEPDVAPPARTPWDLTRSAGGSSGGAAAAVAAGLLPGAPGSDAGGSIRIPASVCGLIGLKPARGRISNGPLAGDVTGLGTHGPIGRTVDDVAALLDAMAGPMPGDPHWAPPLPAGETFLRHARTTPTRPLRIGRYRTPVIVDTDVHPDCITAYEDTTRLLQDLGHDVVDVEPPFRPDSFAYFEVLWAAGAAAAPLDPDQEANLRPLTRWLRDSGRNTLASSFIAALTTVQSRARAAIQATASFAAVLTPTLASPPVPVDFFRNDDDPAVDFEAQKRFTPYTSPYNMTGQPAITLPVHWNRAGLPIGVQLVGRPADEAGLLSLAAQVMAARPLPRSPLW